MKARRARALHTSRTHNDSVFVALVFARSRAITSTTTGASASTSTSTSIRISRASTSASGSAVDRRILHKRARSL
jgi:hypothetical protein